jgi:hypothetical protein
LQLFLFFDTPQPWKGRLSKLEAQLLEQPWKDVRPGLEVKLLAQEKELYILAQSRQRLTTGETLSQIALSSTGPRGRFCSQDARFRTRT